MKQYLIHILLLAGSSIVYGQTTSQNFVLSRTYKQTGAGANEIDKVNIQVQYLDGLGRPSQTVSVGQATDGSDLIVPIEYDAYGRQPKNYLPYAGAAGGPGSNGAFQASGASSQASFYIGNTALLESSDLGKAYHETVFEATPSNRALSQQGPGNKSRSSNFTYGANADSEVALYTYAANADITQTVASSGSYGAGKLYRTETKDDQNNTSIAFTDTDGKLICKRVIASAAETLSTYYVYDDYNLLRAVLQPEYQTGSDAASFAFLYDYDGLGRVITKKIPGAGKVNIVYDKSNHQVMSQDANQLARGVWAFIKYDALGRQVVAGEVASSANRAGHQSSFDESAGHHEVTDGSTVGYSLHGTLPAVAEADVLNVTYYDGYFFPGNQAYANVLSVPANTAVKGRQTGSRARMLNAGAEWLVSTTHYDAEYRPVQQVSQLYDLGGINIERVSTKYKYDLAPVVALELTDHESSGTVTNSVLKTFEYDHADRLLSVKEKVTTNGKTKEATTLAQRYNVLGQLKSKWFHAYAGNATKFRRRTDYVNNIRGWLTSAKTKYQEASSTDQPFFGFELSYNNPLYAPQYSNGNINKILFGVKDEISLTKGLNFTYDGANRLKNTTAAGGYVDTESGITYDRNGNIKTLNRAGAAVDNLSYSYTGNQLTSVNDGSGNNAGLKSGASGYSYDGNGNMTSDGNRGTTLTYNFLNLPKTVTVGSKSFTYDYDASGNKHKYAGDTVNIKYAGPFEYNAGNVVKRVSTSEGQLVPSGDTLRLDYYLKDHLGNVRPGWRSTSF